MKKERKNGTEINKKSLLILMVVFLIILFMFIAQLNCGFVANAEEEKLTFSTSIVEDSSLINLNTTNISQFNNSRFIENSRYFYLNPLHHLNGSSDSKNGVCSTVAMQLLLGYHNYYSDRRIIPTGVVDNKQFLSSDFGDINKHPFMVNSIYPEYGDGSLGTTDEVYNALFDLITWPEFPGLGQNIYALKNATQRFQYFRLIKHCV